MGGTGTRTAATASLRRRRQRWLLAAGRVALDEDRITTRRFVDDGDPGGDAVFDFDVDGHEETGRPRGLGTNQIGHGLFAEGRGGQTFHPPKAWRSFGSDGGKFFVLAFPGSSSSPSIAEECRQRRLPLIPDRQGRRRGCHRGRQAAVAPATSRIREEAFGLLRHQSPSSRWSMSPGCAFARTLAHGLLDDAGLGRTAEIVADGRSPSDCTISGRFPRQAVGLVRRNCRPTR